jgi:hypothetical protein
VHRSAVGAGSVVVFAIAAVYVVSVAWGSSAWSYEVWVAVVVAPILTLGTLAVASGIAARAGDRSIVSLVMVGWTAKLIGSVARWWTVFHFYDKADARSYDNAGRAVGELLRQGTFDLSALPLRGGSTRVIEVASGVVSAITGPSSLAGFFVFAWCAFLGSILLWRAFALAVPQGDQRRYGLLLFLLPSIVYWPSSLGKDAWMLLALGIAAYGAACVFVRRPGGLILVAVGCGAGALVRPHVVLLLSGALAASWITGRAPRLVRCNWIFRAAGGALLVAACAALFLRLQTEFELDAKNDAEVVSLLDRTSQQTSQGGSEFAVSRVRSPLDLPKAAVTVLVRPFPFEANNSQALASSAEGLFLTLFLALAWRRILTMVRVARRTPYLLLCAVYSMGFIVAFSSFGNFGILVRQRVQLLPFVLALACLPRAGHAPSATPSDGRRLRGARVVPATEDDYIASVRSA